MQVLRIVPGRQTFDAPALLDLLERTWATQLRRVSLVIEADAAEEPIEAAADALGQAVRLLGHQELAVRWPGCVAVSITGVAARHSDGGSFWPHWWAVTHHRGSPSRWGSAFLHALDAFGLRAGPDARQSIMLHAGFAPEGIEPSLLHLDPFGHGIQREGVALPCPAAGSLLVFAEDGRYLPAALPPGPVWVASPRDRELTADIPLRIIAESLLPLGWGGWRLVQVDLEQATWLSLADDPRRPVRGQARPRLLPGPAVPGLSTPDGSAVLSGPPALWLPEGAWQVTVERAAGSGPALPADPADLWARFPRPLLGTFTVTARIAGGQPTRQTVTVAEGLTVSYDPPVRLLDDDGLMPSDALFGTEPGLTVTPQALTFTPRETRRRITCVASGQVTSFVAAPPHMRVRTGREWSTAPLHLTRASLEELESVRLEIPGAGDRLVVEVRADGRTVQELTPQARGGYPLRRVLDTVDAHGTVALTVSAGGRSVPVAIIFSEERDNPDPWLCND